MPGPGKPIPGCIPMGIPCIIPCGGGIAPGGMNCGGGWNMGRGAPGAGGKPVGGGNLGCMINQIYLLLAVTTRNQTFNEENGWWNWDALTCSFVDPFPGSPFLKCIVIDFDARTNLPSPKRKLISWYFYTIYRLYGRFGVFELRVEFESNRCTFTRIVFRTLARTRLLRTWWKPFNQASYMLPSKRVI